MDDATHREREYVNVWAPEGDLKNVPVFVWIYGGGDPMHDGENIVKQTGAIVVTFNYRLGALGLAFARGARDRRRRDDLAEPRASRSASRARMGAPKHRGVRRRFGERDARRRIRRRDQRVCTSRCAGLEWGLRARDRRERRLLFFRNGFLGTQMSDAELAVADGVDGYWFRFASSGDPNGNGALAWPAFTTANDTNLAIDSTIATSVGLKKDTCDFWDSSTP